MRLRNGKMLFLALVLVLSGCRTTRPPKIDICIGDGFGGGDCVLKDGTKAYRSPTELKNAWITTQDDMAHYSAWCYDIPQNLVEKEMENILKKAGVK